LSASTQKAAITPIIQVSSLSSPSEVCPCCGSFTSELNRETGWCEECSPKSNYSRAEDFLSLNADRIEYFLEQLAVRDERPICVICGNFIRRAKRTAVFCRKTKECRSYSRKYVYLYTDKKLSKPEALAVILEELG
jgi:hypothetical protein